MVRAASTEINNITQEREGWTMTQRRGCEYDEHVLRRPGVFSWTRKSNANAAGCDRRVSHSHFIKVSAATHCLFYMQCTISATLMKISLTNLLHISYLVQKVI